jgi:hypothetical protein
VETAYVRIASFDNKSTHTRRSNSSSTPPTHTIPRRNSIDPCEHHQFKMVATRRGAQKAPEVAPAPSTLNAPPKRGGRKKANGEATATEPAPAATKPAKTTATKRKANAEPEAAEPPPAKKPAMNTKATRAAKVETKAKPTAAAPKRATRGKKTAEPEAMLVEEPVAVEEAPKPATTRGRKAVVKKASEPKIDEPVPVEEPAVAEEPVEEAPKPATRGRKAPAKKIVAATKPVKAAVTKEPIAEEPAKPAPRARKAAVPKPSLLPPAAAVVRSTRGRNAAAPPPESPLKAPARKPAKKAAAVVAKAESTPMEDVFSEFPGYPTTPAHITAPLTSQKAMTELPNYPNTPAHIVAPISSKDALDELPGYPKTPAHIIAPMTTKAAFAELPDYPKTPAHIKAPISVQAAMAEMPGYPKTPAHITAPVLPMAVDNEEVKQDLSEYVNTPVHADATSTGDDIMAELPDYPTTPAHIQAPMSSKEAINELPGYPETPAHIQAPLSARKALAELPVDYPKTPAHIQAPLSARKALVELPVENPSTPGDTTVATPSTIGLGSLPRDCFATPAHVSSPVVPEEEVAEHVDGPQTPQQLTWGVTNQEAFDELPEYPKTPVHIAAPVSNKDALAELPSYPATPALALEAALQEEITASVKKQSPSPLHFASFSDVSIGRMEASEVTATPEDMECDAMDVDTEVAIAQPMPKLQLAPVQLAASCPGPEMPSPKKSALRSPQKLETKTPKKAVTWEDRDEGNLSLSGGPFEGVTFFVDVTRNGREHNYVFATLLIDLGAKVVNEWSSTGITHVLFKDGSIETLKKVVKTNGAVKCVNVGWALECESTMTRVDETPYLVDLSIAAIPSSPPTPVAVFNPRTPARTPSKYVLPPPTTPTSSEFDHSIIVDDDKENSDVGLFFQDAMKGRAPRTCPPKKMVSVLLERSPMRTPSKANFLSQTPVKPAPVKPASTTKKRSFESSSLGLSLSAPPKRFRLF